MNKKLVDLYNRSMVAVVILIPFVRLALGQVVDPVHMLGSLIGGLYLLYYDSVNYWLEKYLILFRITWEIEANRIREEKRKKAEQQERRDRK